MNFDFDQMPDRQATESLKWRKYDPDVIPLWVADMDFKSPPAVVEALQNRVRHGIFGYAIPIPELYDVVIERLDRLYGWKVTREDLLFIPGVVPGFNLACHAAGKPGSSMIIQTPVYPPFLTAAANASLARIDFLLTRETDGRYSVDFDAFGEAITPKTSLFLLCNPHNPVGRVFSRRELERMAQLCLERDLTIISDEIHCDLVYSESKHIPIASLDPEIARRAITLMAPSKTYNIAGLDCSVAIIQNPELKQKMLKAGGGMVPSVNLLGQVAGLAAYRDGQEWLDALLVYLESNRDFLYNVISDRLPGIHMARPEGTFLAWLDCREADLPVTPSEFFLNHARVALQDGADFGPGGKGFARLNFGCPRSMLEQALTRMQAAMREYAPQANA